MLSKALFGWKLFSCAGLSKKLHPTNPERAAHMESTTNLKMTLKLNGSITTKTSL